MKKVGSIVKELRTSLKMSADTLAGRIGKEGANRKQYIYDIENERIKRFDLQTLQKLATALETEITCFIGPQIENDMLYNGIICDEQPHEPSTINWKEKYYEVLEKNNKLLAQINELVAPND